MSLRGLNVASGPGPAETVSRTVLVILRMYLGVIFLVAVWPKLTADPGWVTRLPDILAQGALQRGHPFYQAFIRNTVLPHVTLFGNLIMTGELLTGISLLTGTATRVGAAGAMFLVLNYMFSKGNWFWTPSSNDAAFFFIGLVLMLGAAGRTLGADHYLAKHYPENIFW